MDFTSKIEHYKSLLKEAPEDAPAPMPDAAPPADPGAPTPPMDTGGDMGMGGEEPDQGEMENEVKRETDPREYTRSILSLLVDDEEGVTPEMFDDFIDSVSLAITKVKDKPGMKRFYNDFYQKLESVLDLREELKSMFKQLTGVMDDLVGAQSEPDNAGGGVGKAGPSGPGVE
jgi:hypothetical protein